MSQAAISSVQNINTSKSKPLFDIKAYFQRIDYAGNQAPTIDTLRAIHLLHAQTIPFENLNPFLRIPVQLDIDSIFEKLVVNGRGGYCFEHNLLLSHVLKTLGFKVKGLAARVLWNIPEGTITPRGHMLLLIEVNEDIFIADVGFGGLSLTAPLQLKIDIEQTTPHEPFRVIKSGEDFVLEANVKQTWKRLYSFGIQENFLPDYEVASWYLSNHPTSHFVTGLIAARPFQQGRYALRNNEFTTHLLNGNTTRQRIENVSDLRAILERDFRINLPDVSDLNAALSSSIQVSADR